MIFSKTDAIFERASRDGAARKALLQKLKRSRRILLSVFGVVVAFLVVAAILVFAQIAPILRGDYAPFDPIFPITHEVTFVVVGLSALIGILSISGAVDADHRVKMLILIDSLDQRSTRRSHAEHDEGGKASPATS